MKRIHATRYKAETGKFGLTITFTAPGDNAVEVHLPPEGALQLVRDLASDTTDFTSSSASVLELKAKNVVTRNFPSIRTQSGAKGAGIALAYDPMKKNTILSMISAEGPSFHVSMSDEDLEGMITQMQDALKKTRLAREGKI